MPGGEEGPTLGGGPAECGVQVRADGPRSAPWSVLIELRWRADDPLSIDLDVRGEPPHPSLPCGHWVVLRDFLCRGLEVPAGDGGVRLWPEPTGDRLHLRLLTAGDADVLLQVPAVPIRAFLRQTKQIVPTGKELPSLLLDDLVNRLRRS